MTYQKVEQPKAKIYPTYQNKDDKKWNEINGKKEKSMISLNAANGAYQLLSAQIGAGIIRPERVENVMDFFRLLHNELVTFLTMQ